MKRLSIPLYALILIFVTVFAVSGAVLPSVTGPLVYVEDGVRPSWLSDAAMTRGQSEQAHQWAIMAANHGRIPATH